MSGTGVRGALRGLRAWPRRIARSGEAAVFPATADPREHWQRVVLNRAVADRIAAEGPERCAAAEVSGSTHADLPWREYVSLDYPAFDLCAPLTEERRFDVVLCEQVLEHVVDPVAAVRNLRGLCAPGGLVIVSTPFLIKVHEVPLFLMKDYWRFTPRGLRTLLESAGLEVERVDSWGNRQCVVGNFSNWSMRRRWHSMKNEPDFPVQVWGFARAPAAAG
jgi:SAM-dependent methyltransferase